VRRGLREQIPEASIGISRASSKEVPRRGERCAEYRRRVALGKNGQKARMVSPQERGRNLPDRDEEHRVAGLTRNTDCGAQCTTTISSSEKAFEGCESTSASIDFEMTMREDSLVTASAGSATWNWNGTGSSALKTKRHVRASRR
jgi:hypothetical protein